jgi:hypothetical protein
MQIIVLRPILNASFDIANPLIHAAENYTSCIINAANQYAMNVVYQANRLYRCSFYADNLSELLNINCIIVFFSNTAL